MIAIVVCMHWQRPICDIMHMKGILFVIYRQSKRVLPNTLILFLLRFSFSLSVMVSHCSNPILLQFFLLLNECMNCTHQLSLRFHQSIQLLVKMTIIRKREKENFVSRLFSSNFVYPPTLLVYERAYKNPN